MLRISTGQLADLLDVPTHRISYLTRDRVIRPPKSPTGTFLWDLSLACRAAELLDVAEPSVARFEALASSSVG